VELYLFRPVYVHGRHRDFTFFYMPLQIPLLSSINCTSNVMVCYFDLFLMLCYIYLFSPHVFGDDVLKCSGSCRYVI